MNPILEKVSSEFSMDNRGMGVGDRGPFQAQQAAAFAEAKRNNDESVQGRVIRLKLGVN